MSIKSSSSIVQAFFVSAGAVVGAARLRSGTEKPTSNDGFWHSHSEPSFFTSSSLFSMRNDEFVSSGLQLVNPHTLK